MNAYESPERILTLILLGGILGMVGQGIRVLVGLKKMQSTADSVNISRDEFYNQGRLW